METEASMETAPSPEGMYSKENRYTYTALIGGLPDKEAVVKEGRAVWKDQEIPYLLEGEEGRGILTVSLPPSRKENSCQNFPISQAYFHIRRKPVPSPIPKEVEIHRRFLKFHSFPDARENN